MSIEIRRNENGSLDELIAPGIHLERMDDDHWWLLVESGQARVHINLVTRGQPIKAYVEDETPTQVIRELSGR